MKLFAVFLGESASVEQRDSLTEHFKAQEWSFWHHIGNSWIVAIGAPDWNATRLRDTVKSFAPEVTSLVAEFNTNDWATFSPAIGHRWLHNYLQPLRPEPSLFDSLEHSNPQLGRGS